MQWIYPQHSKKQVSRAGDNIRTGNATAEDWSILENWRGCHTYVINTFQANLRKRSKGKAVTVAQRLKRKDTIVDKLTRQPEMALSRMHDIAGCRLIFQSPDELYAFRDSMHRSRFKHQLTHDAARYNYIDRPKPSGYRGIHDVYTYKAAYAGGTPWNDLKIELQYRTIYQHAWATAVEVADYIDGNRVKFSEADELHTRFFQLASEIIARVYESQVSCQSSLSNRSLVAEFLKVERRLGLLSVFRDLSQTEKSVPFRGYALLVLPKATPEKGKRSPHPTQIYPADTIQKAVQMYGDLERQHGQDSDIVLVRGEDYDSIRAAFPNYFTDAAGFVSYVSTGLTKLS